MRCEALVTSVRSVPKEIWAWPHNESAKTERVQRGTPLSDFYLTATEIRLDSATSHAHDPLHSELDALACPKKNAMRCFDRIGPRARGNHSQIRTMITVEGQRWLGLSSRRSAKAICSRPACTADAVGFSQAGRLPVPRCHSRGACEFLGIGVAVPLGLTIQRESMNGGRKARFGRLFSPAG
jgi:hypothetical protein